MSELDFLSDVADNLEEQAQELLEQAQMIRDSSSVHSQEAVVPLSGSRGYLGASLDTEGYVDDNTMDEQEEAYWLELEERLEVQRKYLAELEEAHEKRKQEKV